MPGRDTTDAVFIVRTMHEEYRGGLYMCFVDLEKSNYDFDRVSRRVMQWALRKKGIPEILVKAVRNLYESSKTKVKVRSEFSEFFIVIGVHQGSVLLPLLFAIVVDVVTENAKRFCMQMFWYR